MKAFAHHNMRERTMIVAGGFESDANLEVEGVQVIGKVAKRYCSIEQDQAPARFSNLALR